MASANNKYPIIEYLLEKGASIERMDKDSFTPLLLAAHQGRAQALNILLESVLPSYLAIISHSLFQAWILCVSARQGGQERNIFGR